jgi:integrase
MQVGHVQFESDETATVSIPRSKSDPEGDGRVAHLSSRTALLLKRWLTEANIASGPLFRGLHLGHPSGGPLATSSIRRLIKRATQRAGIDASLGKQLSGHSMRIGATQDMMVAGFDALAIMQAVLQPTTRVVMRL